jgi:hypothetical protein
VVHAKDLSCHDQRSVAQERRDEASWRVIVRFVAVLVRFVGSSAYGIRRSWAESAGEHQVVMFPSGLQIAGAELN